MQRLQIKPCSVVLDPNEVVRYLCRKPELCDPVFSIWMSPEEAALVPSILTVVKQEPQDDTEHIKVEDDPSEQLDYMEFVDEAEDFLPQQLDDSEDAISLPEPHIKSEHLEDSEDTISLPEPHIESEHLEDSEDTISLPEPHIKSEHLEDSEDAISLPEHHIDLEDSEDTISLPEPHIESEHLEDSEDTISLPEPHIESEHLEDSEDAISLPEHIKMEPMEDETLSQHFSDREFDIKMEDEIPSHQLGHIEGGIPPHQLKNMGGKIPSHQHENMENEMPSHQLGKMDNEIPPHQLGNMEDGIVPRNFKNKETMMNRITLEKLKKVDTTKYEIPLHSNFEKEMNIRIPPQELAAKKFLDFSKMSETVCDSKKLSGLLKFGNVLPSKHLEIFKKSKCDVQNSIFVYIEKKTKKNLKSDVPLCFIDIDGLSCEQETTEKNSNIIAKNLIEAKMKFSKKNITTIAKVKPINLFNVNESTRENSKIYSSMCSICKGMQSGPVLSFNIKEFNEHLDIHIDTGFRECPHCSQTCININDYYRHIKNCNENLQIGREINFINYVHPGRYNLIKDLRETAECEHDQCEIRLPNLCSKLMHEKCCSLSITSQLSILKFLLITNDSCFKCKVCNAIFKDQSLFQAHCTPPVVFRESLTYCSQCDVNIESEHDYMKHIQSEGHMFKCELCLKNFSCADSYIIHKSSEHNVRMVHCSGCSKTVPLLEFYSHHLYPCLLNDTICILCGQIYEDFVDLIAHVNREISAGLEFENQCRKCLNYFCSKFNLCCHMMKSKCDPDKLRKI